MSVSFSIVEVTSLTALSELLSTTFDTTKAVLSGLHQLQPYAQNILDIRTAFVQARSYIVKCHGLVEYIINEKEYLLKENDVENFNAFLDEVITKVKACQLDLKSIKQSVSDKIKPKIIEEEEKAKADANKKATIGKAVAVSGGVATGAGIGTVAVGIQGAILLPLGMVLGLSMMSVGAASVVKGRNLYNDNVKREQDSDLKLKNYEKLEADIEIIDMSFETAKDNINTTDNSAIYSDKENFIKGLNHIMKQANQFRDYCEPLKEAEKLENFIDMCDHELCIY